MSEATKALEAAIRQIDRAYQSGTGSDKQMAYAAMAQANAQIAIALTLQDFWKRETKYDYEVEMVDAESES